MQTTVHDSYWFWKTGRWERKYALCRPEVGPWNIWLFDERLHRFPRLWLSVSSDISQWHCLVDQVCLMDYHMKKPGTRTRKCTCVLPIWRCFWCQSVLQTVATYLLKSPSTFTEEEGQICCTVLWSWDLQLFPNLFMHNTGHKLYPLLS